MLGTAQVNLSDVCLCVVGEVIMYVTFTVSCIFEHMDLCTCKHLCLCVNLMVCCKVYALLYVRVSSKSICVLLSCILQLHQY